MDPNQILDIRNLIKRIAENRTVILSTHMLMEVQAICDYIFMVEEGHMVFSGSIDEFDNYIIPNTVFVSLLDAPATEVLLEIPGVTKVEELGGTKFRLMAVDVNDVIDQMVAYSYKNAWRLNEIRVEKSSLNAIFAELSKKKVKEYESDKKNCLDGVANDVLLPHSLVHFDYFYLPSMYGFCRCI